MTALPPALDGHEYRSRNIGGDAYQTTGLFRRGAPQGTLEHLVSAPSLVLDCDLVDFERAAGTKTERKAELHALPSADLEARIGALTARVSSIVALLCGAPPTRIVSSGYGVHVYLWLSEADSLRVPEVRRANAALVKAVNEVAGFAIADPAVHDAGTRILRIPGTVNTKNKAIPRPVVVLQSHDTTHDLERWLTAAPQRPAPSVPSASMPPTPSAPYVATSDPFAAAFTREADALAWVLAHCPFFVWAQAHPEQLGRANWRGAGVNIAALAGEGGRAAFHTFSALDPSRYDRSSCDAIYTDALRSAESHGPITYAVLAGGGDWPGPVPDGARSPAASGRQAVKPAASVADGVNVGRSDMVVRINAKSGIPVNDLINIRVLLRADPNYGPRLRYDSLSNQVELDGSACAEDQTAQAQDYLLRVYRAPFFRQWVDEAIRDVARENSYNPIEEYLTGTAWACVPRMASALSNALGADPTDLNVRYLTSTLVGAVARQLDPNPLGVKMDTVLILKGPQGAAKSSFFRIMGGKFFTDSTIDVDSKDAYMSVGASWIVEWAELDHAISRYKESAIKAFLTAQVDRYRPPYGRTVLTVPRRSIIVGTTNQDRFLSDSTGSRRFWVVETRGKVNTELLASMRDQLWAEAVHLYRSGYRWWLNDDEETDRVTASEAYQVEGKWDCEIDKHVREKSLTEVTIDRILIECIQKPLGQWTNADRGEARSALIRLGFEEHRLREGGGRVVVFRRAHDASNVVPLYAPPPAPSHAKRGNK